MLIGDNERCEKIKFDGCVVSTNHKRILLPVKHSQRCNRLVSDKVRRKSGNGLQIMQQNSLIGFASIEQREFTNLVS